MAPPKRKVKKNEVFQHYKTDDFMIVDDAEHMKGKGWLYTLKSVTTSEPEYKRCYEKEFKEKYTKVKNNKAIKVLYGKK